MSSFEITVHKKQKFDDLLNTVTYTKASTYSKIYVGSTTSDIEGYINSKSITNHKCEITISKDCYVVATERKSHIATNETKLLEIVEKLWNGNGKSNYNAKFKSGIDKKGHMYAIFWK